jgi:hypothetical protein
MRVLLASGVAMSMPGIYAMFSAAARLYVSMWNHFMVEKKAALCGADVYLLSAGVSEDLAVART